MAGVDTVLQFALYKSVQAIKVGVHKVAHIARLAAFRAAVSRLAIGRHCGQRLLKWHTPMFLRDAVPLVAVAQQVFMRVELIHDFAKGGLHCGGCCGRVLLRCHLSRRQTQVERDSETSGL